MKHIVNLINGAPTQSASEAWILLSNPATEEPIASVPVGCPEDVEKAVAAAATAQTTWARRPLDDRIACLREWSAVVADHADSLAELECQEMGKPIGVAETFIRGAVTQFDASLADGEQYEFRSGGVSSPSGSGRTVRQPLGVVAVIIPWNFTVASILGTVGPILAAGNTVIIKPSEKAPISAGRLGELVTLPAGVVNIVHGDEHVGAPLAGHPGVNLVHFTGSVRTGRAVAEATSRQLHRVILELGGKDPVVIDDGVDPVAVAEEVAYGAFLNTGQICTSIERIYVHRNIAERFVTALVAAAENYRMGDGHDSDTVIGPLVDDRQRATVHAHVAGAIEQGASLETGGEIPNRKGYFYPATVLTGVNASMTVMSEETFGPVAPVEVVDSFEDGLAAASRTRYGLAATVYSVNSAHIRVAEELAAGLIWINGWQGGSPGAVFEPARDSGMGATGGHAAYDAATRPVAIYQHADRLGSLGTGFRDRDTRS